jgi:ribosomal protein L16 Arg81 hydroxylase
LEPGDALFLPSMWWHHVEALDPVNALVNYWWSSTPDFLGSPADALTHAMMAVKELPPAQRQAWRALFDHYVFDPPEHGLDHIPEACRGRLGKVDETAARRLRAELLNRLKQ